MAIDSAEKRRSISGIGLITPGVTPNASKDQEWRQEACWSYSGILVTIAVYVTPHCEHTVLEENRDCTVLAEPRDHVVLAEDRTYNILLCQ